MTFDPNVPNANQSPGLFPVQMNTDLARLKTIINADHIFNDTAQPDDGAHRQVTMTLRATPVTVPAGTNAILYSIADGLGRPQLHYFNSLTDVQLTPPQELYPIRVVASASLTAGSATTVYADPGFLYAGTGWAIIQSNNVFRFYSLLRSGSNDLHELDSNSGSVSRPTLEFSGNNLRIRNNDASTRICVCSLIINRIS